MDRFENARVFVAVVEAGGFTRAAERLGLSRAAASKHVLQLEDRLGARLLNRTTRRVSVTAAGRAFHEQCRRILAEFDEAERSAGELHNTPSGELRVVAPTNFGLAEIGTAIVDFISAYPRLRINFTMSDRLTDPIEAGYDIAISVDMPRGTSSNLVARKLNTSRRILCAAPDYLRARGVPRSPAELAGHDCLSYSYVSSPDEWHLAGAGGEQSRATAMCFARPHCARLALHTGRSIFSATISPRAASSRSCLTMNCRAQRSTQSIRQRGSSPPR
jgi:DNA-binding transcriptional LysR family regulator